jgi:hypothetical protein
MASEDHKFSKQGTTCRRKHAILTIPQKLEMIWRLGSGES